MSNFIVKYSNCFFGCYFFFITTCQTDFHHAKPIYVNLPGWKEDISGCRTFEELPKNAQDYVKYLEQVSGATISAIGVGQDRNATISVRDLIN